MFHPWTEISKENILAVALFQRSQCFDLACFLKGTLHPFALSLVSLEIPNFPLRRESSVSTSNKKAPRPLSMETAKTYMHAMIFTHISYCYTTWSHTSESTKPIKSLFKRTLKTLDKKPLYYHYCKIANKHKIMDLDSFQQFLDVCLIFKVLNGLAPSPLQNFIKKKIL